VNVHTWHLSIGIGEKQNDLKKAFKEREKFDGAAIKEQHGKALLPRLVVSN
jgi:hypothetical protein